MFNYTGHLSREGDLQAQVSKLRKAHVGAYGAAPIGAAKIRIGDEERGEGVVKVGFRPVRYPYIARPSSSIPTKV